MNNINPRILLIYDLEIEAYKIDNYLKSNFFNNLIGTTNIMDGVRYCAYGKVDIIIAKLSIKKLNLAERLLSKKALVGIPIIFYTMESEEFLSFLKSKILKENKHIKLLLFPTYKMNLYTYIKELYKLKITNKTKYYLLAKEQLGNTQKVLFKDITYIQSEIHSCIIHTKWSSYKITGSLSKVLISLNNSFVKVHQKYIVNSKVSPQARRTCLRGYF